MFSLKTSLLPQIGSSIVKVMDSFNKFNRDIHSKRRDIVMSVAQVKEISTELKSEGVNFDVEEFKKMDSVKQA